MKETGNIFCRAVMAGLGIAMGGIVYLSVENQVIGAFLFAIGLYAIVLNGLFLYTGKVGYLVVEKRKKNICSFFLLHGLGISWEQLWELSELQTQEYPALSRRQNPSVL